MNSSAVGLVRRIPGTLSRVLPFDLAFLRVLLDSAWTVVHSGATITAPFLVTAAVIGFVLNFVANVLAPFVAVLSLTGVTAGHHPIVASAITVLALFTLVVAVGVANETGVDRRFRGRVGRTVEGIPAVGSVYTSFDRMSDALFASDSQSFKEVKLIEFPHDDLYSLAFVTSELPADVGAGENMHVCFVPLAPNPVMGGFMVCVAEENIYDIDLTVQQAFQAIVTSGVAIQSSEEHVK